MTNSSHFARCLAGVGGTGARALVLGSLLGASFVLAAASGLASSAADEARPVLDAAHLPPLLTVPGEPVELRYDIFCSDGSAGGNADVPCDAEATAFVRSEGSAAFQPLPLRLDRTAAEGRFVVSVPVGLRDRGGFDYYAVFRSERAGMSMTLPAGGAEAPQQSRLLDRALEVDLGRHEFGATRRTGTRVVAASWGEGQGDVGLEQGVNLPPTGGSSFDVDSLGTVHVLDEVHHRVLRWSGGAQRPTALPLVVDGTLADLSVGDDGAFYVLESATAARRPLLRRFDRTGREVAAVETAERTASQVRLTARGPVVLEHPSGQWMPLAVDGVAQTASAQRRGGRAGRGILGQGEVVVLRTENEIRAAIVGPAGVRRSWRVTSETPVAEIQLAEPSGNRLVVVARLYTDSKDEFVVLVLGQGGLLRSFSLDSADWAETAPLSRFRLEGSNLYHLGSTAAGLFVDRFDLEVE